MQTLSQLKEKDDLPESVSRKVYVLSMKWKRELEEFARMASRPQTFAPARFPERREGKKSKGKETARENSKERDKNRKMQKYERKKGGFKKENERFSKKKESFPPGRRKRRPVRFY